MSEKKFTCVGDEEVLSSDAPEISSLSFARFLI
jgi:hypothetical protein